MIDVTPLGLGTGPLANLYRAIPDERATATVEAAWEAGVRYFDTAPHYGAGLGERRLGRVLAAKPRDGFVVSTKVGRVLVDDPAVGSDLANGFDTPATQRRVWDMSATGVRRSLDDSLTRLGLDRVDIALIHDPEASPDPLDSLRTAYPALDEMRRAGVVRAIGVGTSDVPLLLRFARETDADVLMVAGRYTLLDRAALDEVLPACVERGIAVLAAAVFNSGLLAGGATYDYRPAGAPERARAAAIAAVCARYGVTLPHAAVAFPLRHPAVASVVVGADHPAQITDDAAWVRDAPPPEMWDELTAEGLIP